MRLFIHEVSVFWRLRLIWLPSLDRYLPSSGKPTWSLSPASSLAEWHQRRFTFFRYRLKNRLNPGSWLHAVHSFHLFINCWYHMDLLSQFLFIFKGYTEELLSRILKCPVRMDIQTCRTQKDLIFKSIWWLLHPLCYYARLLWQHLCESVSLPLMTPCTVLFIVYPAVDRYWPILLQSDWNGKTFHLVFYPRVTV